MKIEIELKPQLQTVILERPLAHASKYPERYSVYTVTEGHLLLWSTTDEYDNTVKGVRKAHESHAGNSISQVIVFDGDKPALLHTQFHTL